MDDHPNPNAKYTHSSTSDAESPSHASGMFSHSNQFTVTGKTFTNITNHYAAPRLPSDFRMIPMGDIDLRHEIRVNERTGVAYSRGHRACVRRMHSAKARIDGRKSRVTVVIYQGNDAEKEWRKDIAKYMSIRHPNIIQICGAANSNGIFAAIFNDVDLIPLAQCLDRYRNPHFSTVYIYACCVCAHCAPSALSQLSQNRDFSEAYCYIYSEFHRGLSPFDCTKWIRRSTGRLCAELIPADYGLWLDSDRPEAPAFSGIYSSSEDTETTTFIDSLTLEQYHAICRWNLGQHQWIALSANTTVNLGVVFRYSGNPLEDSIEIASLSSMDVHCLGDWRNPEGSIGEGMPSGWTRFGGAR
ncbi:hypothetical protein MSAN_02134600 [Mycena sanguinolenta]|uniref:Protein kinase domain-containing protein n=1 Tax=Mycena sanguinolenta TaxID=230812 RepID=A0A8H6XHJ1_9AGAR|nr:hypothetical protein MSAN_02134600 [Mycena sanguinolenta]